LLVDRGISRQRACTLLDLHRSTFYYQPRPDQNAELAQRVRELAYKHLRYGYRRIWALLRREQKVNKKRIYRLWRPNRLVLSDNVNCR
jgi:putative transposase